jgi:5-(carboxyamino)imidazole ribonucleotide mutase
MNSPIVSIIMGSQSDWTVMQQAKDMLDLANVPAEVCIVSAHRTPEWMVEFAHNAADRGIQVIIAGAGGAAHLPGMVASMTHLPVVGVPVKSTHSLAGLDSLLSIVQMPAGIPVATVAIDGAKNAALLAIRIIALQNVACKEFLVQHQNQLKNQVLDQNHNFNL